MKIGRDRLEKLDALLADALSPETEAPPVALDLERARLRIVREQMREDRRIESGFTLIGFAAAILEIVTILCAMATFEPQGLSLAAAIFGLFQATGLLTCSLGSRTAIKRIRTQTI